MNWIIVDNSNIKYLHAAVFHHYILNMKSDPREHVFVVVVLVFVYLFVLFSDAGPHYGVWASLELCM